MKKIPLFGAGTVGKSAVVTSARRLNCYYEIRPDGEKAKFAVYGTPGTTLFTSIGLAPVRGWWVMGNTLYAVMGANLYQISSLGVATSRGTLNTTTGFVSMVDNGTQLMMVDGTNGYLFAPGTVTFAQISDPDFPNGATTVGFLTGFFLVEKPNTGQFFKSGSYDGLSWSATDFATAESNPDNLIAISVDHSLAILWGDVSIEFWQNIGTLGFPFAPLQGASQQWGLAAKWSRVVFNNTIAFLAKNLQGQVQVMMLNGFVPQRISDSDTEEIINSFSIVADAVGLSYMLDGHSMYQLTFQSAARSFLYDGSTGIWSEVQTGLDPIARHVAQLGITYNGHNYVSDFSNGNIYLVDPTAQTDNGASIKRLIQTKHIHDEGNVTTVDEVFLDMETGVGLQSGQGSNPIIVMQVSKDGGRTWGNERWTSFGAVGQYLGPRATWRRLGSARDFVLRFFVTDPVKFALTYGACVTRGKNQ